MKYLNFVLLLFAATTIQAQDRILRYEYEDNNYGFEPGACYQALELDTISKTGRFYIDGCYLRVGYAEMSIKIVQVNKDSLVFYPDDIAIISVGEAIYGKGGIIGEGVDSPNDPKEFGKDIYNFTIYFKKKGKRLETKGCTCRKGMGYETSIKFQSQLRSNIVLFGLIEWLPPYMKKVKEVKWERLDSDYKERVRRFYEERKAYNEDIIYTDHTGVTFSPFYRK